MPFVLTAVDGGDCNQHRKIEDRGRERRQNKSTNEQNKNNLQKCFNIEQEHYKNKNIYSASDEEPLYINLMTAMKKIQNIKQPQSLTRCQSKKMLINKITIKEEMQRKAKEAKQG